MAQFIPLCPSAFVACPSICKFGLCLDISIPVPLCDITYLLSLCVTSLIHFVLTLRHLVFCAPAILDLPILPTGGGPLSVSVSLSGRSPTRPVHLYPRRP